MKLLETSRGTVIYVHVKPNSKEFKMRIENDELVVFCRETPEKGRVNKELMKELSKFFKKRTEIVSGFTSKQKRILVRDTNQEEISNILFKNASNNV